jgi:hypothetical protein
MRDRRLGLWGVTTSFNHYGCAALIRLKELFNRRFGLGLFGLILEIRVHLPDRRAVSRVGFGGAWNCLLELLAWKSASSSSRVSTSEGEGESEGAKGVVGLDLGRVEGGGDSIDGVTVATEGEGEVGDSKSAGPLTTSAKESLLARRGEPSAVVVLLADGDSPGGLKSQ